MFSFNLINEAIKIMEIFFKFFYWHDYIPALTRAICGSPVFSSFSILNIFSTWFNSLLTIQFHFYSLKIGMKFLLIVFDIWEYSLWKCENAFCFFSFLSFFVFWLYGIFVFTSSTIFFIDYFFYFGKLCLLKYICILLCHIRLIMYFKSSLIVIFSSFFYLYLLKIRKYRSKGLLLLHTNWWNMSKAMKK